MSAITDWMRWHGEDDQIDKTYESRRPAVQKQSSETFRNEGMIPDAHTMITRASSTMNQGIKRQQTHQVSTNFESRRDRQMWRCCCLANFTNLFMQHR